MLPPFGYRYLQKSILSLVYNCHSVRSSRAVRAPYETNFDAVSKLLFIPMRFDSFATNAEELPLSLVRIGKRLPRVAAIVPSTIASCQIGVLKPLSALARRGQIQLRKSLESRASLMLIHWADIVVFCRNTEPAYAHLLSEALSTHKPIVFDLDDNFWDVPFETDPELARYHRLPLRLQQLEKYLRHATLIRVYSPALQQIVEQFNPNVRLLKAGFDFELAQSRPRATSPSAPVHIVYATSRIVDNQYLLFAEALRKILDDYGDKVQMTIWGCQPADLVGLKGIRFNPLVGNYEKFLRKFIAQGFDIGLAPLEDTHFHRSKTNTKFRDYGAARVAGIYSNVCVYSDCVQNEQTGLLVPNTTQGWYDGIARLIEDAKLRRHIQETAYTEVYAGYRQEVVEHEWLEEIGELLSDSPNYSLNSGCVPAVVKEVLVRADRNGLCSISFPSVSPGDEEPVRKLLVEIFSTEGNLIRERSAMTATSNRDHKDITLSFAPIQNSRFQEFVLRFISVSDETENEREGWMPTSAYITMSYAQSVDANRANEEVLV